MSTRRLEMSVEQMKAKTTNQLAEIGKKSEAVGRLKIELGEKTAALFALEAKEKQLADDLQSVRAELAGKCSVLEETERALASTQAELARTGANFHESSLTGDSQRVELVALRAQTELLKGQIESFEKDAKDLRERLGNKTAEVEMLIHQLADERAKAEQLGNRVGEVDRQIIVQTTESEVLTRRVQELTARLDEQGRFLADREFASDGLRNDATAAQKIEADIRAELANAEARHRTATEAIRGEKSLVEDQLKQSHEERATLQREIATMKRDAENAWANERMENAVLRERINDVAAEVARLTATLEGPESPIDTILRADAGRPAMEPGATNGSGTPSIAPSGAESKGTLADRIRALQGRASSAPQPSRA
jgi:chromosome segregation ATPase